eukprot:scaffold165014_cov36-Prasinocladus_malaysianus.AAC.2
MCHEFSGSPGTVVHECQTVDGSPGRGVLLQWPQGQLDDNTPWLHVEADRDELLQCIATMHRQHSDKQPTQGCGKHCQVPTQNVEVYGRVDYLSITCKADELVLGMCMTFQYRI